MAEIVTEGGPRKFMTIVEYGEVSTVLGLFIAPGVAGVGVRGPGIGN